MKATHISRNPADGLEAMHQALAVAREQYCEARRALAASEAYFRALIDNALDLITILERDGTIRYQNPSVEHALGYKPEELVGRHCLELVHPDDRERVAAALEQALAEPSRSERVEFRVRHKNNSWRMLEGIGKNLLDEPAVGGIIVNSRDITGQKETEGQLKELFRRLIEVQEVERRRVARELHDGVNQILSSSKFRIQSAEEKMGEDDSRALIDIRRGRMLIDSAMQELRHISRNLRPSVLDDLGLIAAIHGACDVFRESSGITLDFNYARLAAEPPSELKLHLYRIIQEALSNIQNHSQATRAVIDLRQSGGWIVLSISDNGKGFDAVARRPGRPDAGFGLIHIRERAALVGGAFALSSAPGGGTEMTIRIPTNAETMEKSES